MKEIKVLIDDVPFPIIKDAADKRKQSVASFIQYAALFYAIGGNPALGTDSQAAKPDTASGIKRGGKRKARRAPTQEDAAVFDHFIHYLDTTLCNAPDKYEWRYVIRPESQVEWMDEKLFTGATREENDEFLHFCSRKLHEAIITQNETLCFEAVRIAMDWTNTYYSFSRGTNRGNEELVNSLLESHLLLETVSRNAEYIKSGDVSKLEYYTTGWGAVWYMLDLENMVLMSSRAVYAMNAIIFSFKQEFGLNELPDALDLGQLVYTGHSRYIDGVRYIYTLKGKLKMLKKYLKITKSLSELGHFKDFSQLDGKLFQFSDI